MNTLLRFLLVLFALVGYRQTLAADAVQATDKATAAATAPARVPNGYKAKVLDGETVYCRKSTPLGTRFPTEVCMTVAQYEEFVLQGDGLRQELTGKQKSLYIPPDPGRGGS